MPSHPARSTPWPGPFRPCCQRTLLGLLLLAGCRGQCSLVNINYARYGEILGEHHCNVVGDLFSDYCPDCALLPLNNNSFQAGSGVNRTPWRGDRAVIVEGVTDNVPPCIANRMLRFEATYETDPSEQDDVSTSYQLIDLRDTPLPTETVTFVARALFNRWERDGETDRVFRLSLTAYSGDLATFDPSSPAHQQLASNTESLVADARTDSWNALFTELTVSSSGLDFLHVAIAAVEDLVDDPGTAIEFDAQFADNVRVGYTSAEHDLGLRFQVWPQRTRIAPGNKVVYQLTFTNYTPDEAVTRALVATDFANRMLIRTASNDQRTRLTQHYLYHAGDGTYDPERGTWRLDRPNNTARLYVAMETIRINGPRAGAFWDVHASILGDPRDRNANNNRDTVRVSPPLIDLGTTAPDLVLRDTTLSIGDTITTQIFEEEMRFIASSVSAVLSDSGVAQVRFSNEEIDPMSHRHYMHIVGLAEGRSTVIVTASDPYNSTADFFTLTVLPPQPNRPPVAIADALHARPDTVTFLDVLFNDYDPDGDAFTLFHVGPPACRSIVPDDTTGIAEITSDGRLRYRPCAGFTGLDVFTYSLVDAHGARSGEAEVRVDVNNNPDTVSLGETVTFTLTVINHGPSGAAGVEVIFPLPPPNFTNTNPQATQGTYTLGTWSVGTLSSGQNATLTVTGEAAITQGQSVPLLLIPLARITGGLGGNDDPANNTASATLTINN